MPKENMEKIIQIIFTIQAVLTIWKSFKFADIVANLEDGATYFVQMFDGYSYFM